MPEDLKEDEDSLVLRTAQVKVRESADGARVIDIIASTADEDSYGEIVEQKWDLTRFQSNPVILWAHKSNEMPIGTGDVKLVNGQLVGTITLTTDEVNPRAGEVWRAYQAKILRGISVGFRPHSYRWEKKDDREVLILSDNELYEISACPIPANPNAVMRMRQRALAAKSQPTRETNMNEEEKKLLAAALAVTGKSGPSEALGALHGLHEKASRVDGLVKENAELKLKLDAGDRARALDVARRAKKLTPAMEKDEKWMKLTSGFTPEQLSAYFDTLPEQIPAAAESAEKAPSAEGSVQLTDDDREVCRRTGTDPEKFLAHKRAMAKSKAA